MADSRERAVPERSLRIINGRTPHDQVTRLTATQRLRYAGMPPCPICPAEGNEPCVMLNDGDESQEPELRDLKAGWPRPWPHFYRDEANGA